MLPNASRPTLRVQQLGRCGGSYAYWGLLHRGKCGRGAKPTTHFQTRPRLEVSGAVPPLAYMPSWNGAFLGTQRMLSLRWTSLPLCAPALVGWFVLLKWGDISFHFTRVRFITVGCHWLILYMGVEQKCKWIVNWIGYGRKYPVTYMETLYKTA